MASFRSGSTLVQVVVSGDSENSAIVPEQMLTFGYRLKTASCRSHRSGQEISSLSIRATSSFLQCRSPSLSALPKPMFFSSRTTVKTVPICRCFSAKLYEFHTAKPVTSAHRQMNTSAKSLICRKLVSIGKATRL